MSPRHQEHPQDKTCLCTKTKEPSTRATHLVHPQRSDLLLQLRPLVHGVPGVVPVCLHVEFAVPGGHIEEALSILGSLPLTAASSPSASPPALPRDQDEPLMYCPAPLTLPQPPNYMNRGAAGRTPALWEVVSLHASGVGRSSLALQCTAAEDAGALLAKGAHISATPSCVLGLRASSPVQQKVQHLLGGGEGPVSAQEDGDVGGVIALEG